MKYLIDTHVFLWFVVDSDALSNEASKLIQNSANQIYVSTASLWEMAIKYSIGKLELPTSYAEFIPHQLFRNDFAILQIGTPHLHQVAELDFHHKDPFDRLIIAQAISEDIPIITKDHIFDSYAIERVWDTSTTNEAE